MDNYKILKNLDRGSFGSIYLVTDKLNKQYVLKKIDLVKSVSENKMNCSEVLIGVFNNCPYIMKYQDFHLSKNSLYLIMKYCKKGTLKLYLKNKLDINKKNKVISSIISGIQYLHNNKVIHRDLKSDNILMDDGSPIISDFGTCKILNEFEYFGNTAIGTPYYLSPEIASGTNHTYQADIYSLGCILCEVYKNKLPYSGKNIGNLFYNVSRSKMDIYLTNSNIDILIKRMLNNDPSKRPSINQVQTYFDTKVFLSDSLIFKKDKVFMEKVKLYNMKSNNIQNLVSKIKSDRISLPSLPPLK